MPQITAIAEGGGERARETRDSNHRRRRQIKYSGEITKAVAAGASSVMIGSLFAGVDESPGETDSLPGTQLQELSRMDR